MRIIEDYLPILNLVSFVIFMVYFSCFSDKEIEELENLDLSIEDDGVISVVWFLVLAIGIIFLGIYKITKLL